MALGICLISTSAVRADASHWVNAYPSISYAFPSYPDPLGATTDYNRRVKDSSHLPLLFEVGAYHVMGSNGLALGPQFGFLRDSYGSPQNSSSINQYLFSGSALYFTSHTYGDGLFVRIDLGVSFARASNSFGESVTSNLGPHLLCGAGYSFAPLGGIRIAAHANYSIRLLEGSTYTSLALGLGLLL